MYKTSLNINTNISDNKKAKEEVPPPVPVRPKKSLTPADISLELQRPQSEIQTSATRTYQNLSFPPDNNQLESMESPTEKIKSLNRKGFLKKFRRSISMNPENASEITNNLNKPRSTFYLTDTIVIDNNAVEDKKAVSPVSNNKVLTRPQSPPPPAPTGKKDIL